MDQRWRTHVVLLPPHAHPGSDKRVQLPLERLFGGILTHRTNDDAAGIVRQNLLRHLPETLPLRTLTDLPAHANPAAVRHVYEKAAGHRKLRSASPTLGGNHF